MYRLTALALAASALFAASAAAQDDDGFYVAGFIGNGENLFNAEVSDDFDGTSLTIGARYKF
jgi:hypothetical protein